MLFFSTPPLKKSIINIEKLCNMCNTFFKNQLTKNVQKWYTKNVQKTNILHH